MFLNKKPSGGETSRTHQRVLDSTKRVFGSLPIQPLPSVYQHSEINIPSSCYFTCSVETKLTVGFLILNKYERTQASNLLIIIVTSDVPFNLLKNLLCIVIRSKVNKSYNNMQVFYKKNSLTLHEGIDHPIHRTLRTILLVFYSPTTTSFNNFN